MNHITQVNNVSEFDRFLGVLDQAKCLKSILAIGSWAEHIYRETGMLKGYEANMRTLDADFLVKNLHLPRTPVDLPKIAKENGYLYQEDYMTGGSRMIGEDGFEIEFLIAQRGSGSRKLPKTNLGIYAQELTHLDVLLRFSTDVIYHGFAVSVPEPEAYVLHKIIINQGRGVKAAKDRDSIARLYPCVNQDRYRKIFETLSRKEQITVQNFQEQYPDLFLLSSKEESMENKGHRQ